MNRLSAWLGDQRRRGNLIGPIVFAAGLAIFASRPLWQNMVFSLALAGGVVVVSKWEARTQRRQERVQFALGAASGLFAGGYGVLLVLSGPFIIDGWGNKLLLVFCGSIFIALGLPGLASILDRRSASGGRREEVAEDIQALYLRTTLGLCTVPVALVGVFAPGALLGRVIVIGGAVALGIFGWPALGYWRTRFDRA